MSVPLVPILISPSTLNAWLTVKIEGLFPFPSVKDLQEALPVVDGWFGPVKFASPMMASRVEIGTPAVQFAAALQSVLAVPFHEVWADAARATKDSARQRLLFQWPNEYLLIVISWIGVWVCL